ncbi:tetratricopeptide repeat protein [compost metagenome]
MTTNDDPLQQGHALFQAQQYDEAIQVLSTISPSVPRRYAEALALLGRAHSKLRQFDRAAEILEEAYERNPQPNTQFFWAEALIQLGRKAEAFTNLEEATKRDESLTDAFIHLGILKEERGLLQDAIVCFEKALVNDSKAVVARYRLAKIAFDKGDLKRAATQAYLVQQIAGNYPPVHKLMGSIALTLGDHRQAAVELCRVIELGEADNEVYLRLGKAFANIGDLPQALMAYEQAIKRNPAQPQVIQVAARLAQRLEDFPRAAAYYFILLDDPKLGEQAKGALEKLEAYLAALPPPPPPVEEPTVKKGGLKGKPLGSKLSKPGKAAPAPMPGSEAKHILPEIPENPRFNPPKILERKTEPLAPTTGSNFVAETGFAPGSAPSATMPQPKPRPVPSRPAPTAPLTPPAAARPPERKTSPLSLPSEKLSQVTDLGREKLSQVTDMGRERLNQVTDMGREKLQGMSRDVLSKVKQAPATEKGFDVFNKVMQGYKDAVSRFPKLPGGSGQSSGNAASSGQPEPKFKLTGGGGAPGTGKLPPKPSPNDPKKR